MASRRVRAWREAVPDEGKKYAWLAEASNGQFHNGTFPRSADAWQSSGVSFYRTGWDTFQYRVWDKRRDVRPGGEVWLTRGGQRLKCRVLRCEPTNTEEVKSRNCGACVLELVCSGPVAPRKDKGHEQGRDAKERGGAREKDGEVGEGVVVDAEAARERVRGGHGDALPERGDAHDA